MCYSLWYNAPTMLPAGHRPAGNIVGELYHKLQPARKLALEGWWGPLQPQERPGNHCTECRADSAAGLDGTECLVSTGI